jgi:hypothetical protein
MRKFNIGDRLRANEFDRENYDLTWVTITEIDEENEVYHWQAEEPLTGDAIHSGYFFPDAVKYDEREEAMIRMMQEDEASGIYQVPSPVEWLITELKKLNEILDPQTWHFTRIEIYEKAKRMEKERDEHLRDFDTWKEWKNK